LVNWLSKSGVELQRIGLEAGPLSPWLYEGLRTAGLPVVCIETRRMKGATAAMAVKTDRNDARAIAQAIRVGWFTAVHVKTAESQELRLLLNNRRTLQAALLTLDNEIRGTLKAFGLKVGAVTTAKFEGRVTELVADHPRLLAMVRPMLIVRSHSQSAGVLDSKQGANDGKMDPQLLARATGSDAHSVRVERKLGRIADCLAVPVLQPAREAFVVNQGKGAGALDQQVDAAMNKLVAQIGAHGNFPHQPIARPANGRMAEEAVGGLDRVFGRKCRHAPPPEDRRRVGEPLRARSRQLVVGQHRVKCFAERSHVCGAGEG
jgi:hypothetical protein